MTLSDLIKSPTLSIATTLVGLGILYGKFTSKIAIVELRQDKAEVSQPIGLKWQTDQNTRDIANLQTDQKGSAATITVMQRQIDVMAMQVGFIYDEFKKGNTK